MIFAKHRRFQEEIGRDPWLVGAGVGEVRTWFATSVCPWDPRRLPRGKCRLIGDSFALNGY
jgi:hypothetical protein